MGEFATEVRLGSESVSEKKLCIERACRSISQKDYGFFPAEVCRELLQEVAADPLSDWQVFRESWDRLKLDTYMADGGKYRMRRHATLSALPSSVLYKVEPHQAHYQSLNYNTLNGGIARYFEPIDQDVIQGATMSAVIRLGCEIFGRLRPYCSWHIEVHQFRIEAKEGGIGKPTPEGVHRDGVGFVMMLMIGRTNLVSGSTTIYDLDKRRLDEFTLQCPLDLAIVNDEQVYHGVTPIVQLDTDKSACRDVLVITFKRKAQGNRQ
jgi:hypothetical protein